MKKVIELKKLSKYINDRIMYLNGDDIWKSMNESIRDEMIIAELHEMKNQIEILCQVDEVPESSHQLKEKDNDISKIKSDIMLLKQLIMPLCTHVHGTCTGPSTPPQCF